MFLSVTLFLLSWRFWAAYLFFPLMVFAWLWFGPLWGLASAVWAIGLVGAVGLAARQIGFLWVAVGIGLVGWLTQYGMNRWRGLMSAAVARTERLEEQVNTLRGQMRHLHELEMGLRERLTRYQQLRQMANQFSANLDLDELLQEIVQATGRIVENADRVLLYLVNPQSLTLELQAVWRRTDEPTIKAKTGDAFDHWVMRQGQPLLVQEPTQDFRFSETRMEMVGRSLGALVVVPLISEARFLGVLRVESVRSHGLGPEELRLARIIGDLATFGIENSRLYSRMAELAITDDLTGLAVRTYFEKRVTEEIARAAAHRTPLSLLLIDIDHFKIYNDSFGHSAGDKLLKHLAQLLLQTRRSGEVAGRYGGEEFAYLLPGTNAEEAAKRAEKIRAQVEATQVELRRSMTQVTVSIGVASFPVDGPHVEALLQSADRRLYQAKAKGRNQVCLAR